MGNCCGGEDDSANSINTGKKGQKHTGTANTGGEVNNFDSQNESDDILDYINDKVKIIYKENGDYKEGTFKGASATLKERPISKLENNAKYKGQWN